MADLGFDGVRQAWAEEGTDKEHSASKLQMVPCMCSIMPMRFSDMDLESSYVRAQKTQIKRWTIALCVISLIGMSVQACMFQLNPMRSKAEALGILARIVICAQMLVSLCLLRWNTEVASLMLFVVYITFFPLLSHQRACWTLGEAVEELWPLKNDAPESDMLFVLSMLAIVITFLVLVPVRVTRGWVIPTVTPIVYLCWTLWLPQPGLEGGFVNRLAVGFALVFVCFVLLLGRAEVELATRLNFEKKHIAEKLMIKEKVHRFNVEFLCSPKPRIPEEDDNAQTGNVVSNPSHPFRPEPTLQNHVNGCNVSGDNSLFYSVSSSSGTRNDACTTSIRLKQISDLGSKVRDLESETKSLQLQLLVCRHVAEVGGRALKAVSDTELRRTNERHWARTRALIASMEQSHNTMRSTRRDVHNHGRSITLSGTSMASLMSELEAMSNQHDKSFQGLGPTSDSNKDMNPHIRSQNTTGPTLEECDALDGTWELADEDDDVEEWLRRLVINGTTVIDGIGSRIQLKQSSDSRMLLEGGTVYVVDGVLHRIGKSKTELKFKRVCAGGACSSSM